MFQPVGSKVDFPAMEEHILALWKSGKIFEKSVAQREGSPPFILYEGPPTANGNPGIHHVLARVFKDVMPRYKAMKGFYAPRRAGWDTHGLPVELEVEKELGFSSKTQIEAYGVEKFNARCRQSVFKYLKEWENLTDRIGFWVDMEHPYVTLRNEYIETGWWIIKTLWDRKLLYQGFRVTPHCPRCGTSLSSHEVALGYRDDADDPSVYIKFRLDLSRPGGSNEARQALYSEAPTYFLVWTTTPWTLPGNTALALDPDADYALVEYRNEQDQTERIIMAKALLASVIKQEYSVVTTLEGSDLVGFRYEPLFDPESFGVQFTKLSADYYDQAFGSHDKFDVKVIAGGFVSLTDGTGIVHIAPAFGEVDYEVGRKEGLFFVQPVDLQGKMTGNYPFAGKFVKVADEHIIGLLKTRGLLFRSERIVHTYPFCWRCSSPLLYYAKPSWYIKTTAVKEAMQKGNQQINWYPEHIKEGRFGDWLRNNVDWALSRERYWGTPLPIWRCQGCGHEECMGSVDDIRRLAHTEAMAKVGYSLEECLEDLHRPSVDNIILKCPEGTHYPDTMRRVPEVLDCWFDSGAMPFAQWHHPFYKSDVNQRYGVADEAGFKRWFPADYICEAVDQTRGWFYTLHALATLVKGEPCFRNVICLGLILDARGEKMSKAKGNVVDPWKVLKERGADALRWYMLTASPPGNVRRFDTNQVVEVWRQFLLTLWNTYSFFVTYALIDKYDPATAHPPSNRPGIDRWILSELNSLIQQVTERLDDYDPTAAGRAIAEFVDNLSNWYVRRSRRRFWKSENDADKQAAYATLYECLVTVSKLLAPFTPFVAEEIYQNLARSVYAEAKESIHLTDYPVADPDQIDAELSQATRLAMLVSSLGRSARAKVGIKVRQPIKEVRVFVNSAEEARWIKRYDAEIAEELNCKGLVPIVQRRARGATEAARDVDLIDLVAAGRLSLQVQPKVERIGPKFGPRTAEVVGRLKGLGIEDKIAIRRNLLQKEETVFELALDGDRVASLTAEDLEIVYSGPVASEGPYLVWIDDQLTPELKAEGLAREIVHRLQTMRKNAGFDIADYIVTYYEGAASLEQVMRDERLASYIKQETLSREIVRSIPSEFYKLRDMLEQVNKQIPADVHKMQGLIEKHRLEGQEITLAVKKK